MQRPGESSASLRVGVIGARRAANGTGPFLGLQASRAGADLVTVYGTTPASAAEASAWFEVRGVTPRPTSTAADFFAQKPQVVIVASPSGTHESWVRAALQQKAHVLCEKPLLAGCSSSPQERRGEARRARKLARDFAAAGLVFREACQWAWTLSLFSTLHPQWQARQSRSFSMCLAPGLEGEANWRETLSHPISVLQAAIPGPAELEEIRFHKEFSVKAPRSLEFVYRTAAQKLRCEVKLAAGHARPRPAEYRFDQALFFRKVKEPGYRIFFENSRNPQSPGYRCEPAPDPMNSLVISFLAQVEAARAGGAVTMDDAMLQRQELLAELLVHYAS